MCVVRGRHCQRRVELVARGLVRRTLRLGVVGVVGAFVTTVAASSTSAGRTFGDLAKGASGVDHTNGTARKALLDTMSAVSRTLKGAFHAVDGTPAAELRPVLTSAPECAAFNY